MSNVKKEYHSAEEVIAMLDKAVNSEDVIGIANGLTVRALKEALAALSVEVKKDALRGELELAFISEGIEFIRRRKEEAEAAEMPAPEQEAVTTAQAEEVEQEAGENSTAGAQIGQSAETTPQAEEPVKIPPLKRGKQEDGLSLEEADYYLAQASSPFEVEVIVRACSPSAIKTLCGYAGLKPNYYNRDFLLMELAQKLAAAVMYAQDLRRERTFKHRRALGNDDFRRYFKGAGAGSRTMRGDKGGVEGSARGKRGASRKERRSQRTKAGRLRDGQGGGEVFENFSLDVLQLYQQRRTAAGREYYKPEQALEAV